MDIEKIKLQYTELNQELKRALARMDRSDRVFIIKDAIKNLQQMCPHGSGTYDFSDSKECPYCGKKFKG